MAGCHKGDCGLSFGGAFMEEEQEDNPNYQFMSLVYSLSQTAMMQLGKITNPLTGKMERNIVQAKATIDMMEMLKEKTKGNLTRTEEKMILTNLSNLYLNYSDEVNKEPAQPDKPGSEKQEEKK
ncbi:DUF1844 domain-containing protein [Candidatus Desantisbacteria bacterium CG_4_10_14_0_8_um_filter_48_22]|uniref:DUF1844 domain-containing protein n=1 Tax=Candidatus Desantisbacteria bacterium CG_4_10_14_0_8_um_filter_48_22 TaxID=1974543 RepID=A0A2M7S566_9BACT|nr:MAG: DUF1844 domain-containing protein [Candidatus Desantisbacteria bacterium CG02_land_8_20_14_3_00_49_13]PIZ14674.1 MAG: DUF1844 domain-containing protein [Candidatus Desantisbacteria bacterium CG_4_10_14_0_8_um_filter_48_22]PJB27231.1 MAG: DUF1844 domain-containing protein [Candidatus Desantisbacteria bacterium CG_4_9_14_3_um_filter_50_7]